MPSKPLQPFWSIHILGGALRSYYDSVLLNRLDCDVCDYRLGTRSIVAGEEAPGRWASRVIFKQANEAFWITTGARTCSPAKLMIVEWLQMQATKPHWRSPAWPLRRRTILLHSSTFQLRKPQNTHRLSSSFPFSCSFVCCVHSFLVSWTT